ALGQPGGLHRRRAPRSRGTGAGQGDRHGDPDAVQQLQGEVVAMGRFCALLTGLWLALLAFPASAGPFDDWAAVVVAGDWHAHSGGPSEAFDNARRDVSQALERAGFQPQNLKQFSVRPERYKDAALGKSSPEQIYDGLASLTAKATGGCLVYFSSHGSPQGVLIDQQILPPGVLAAMLDRTCGQRPTVVIVSACFSGVFVPAL